MANHAAGIMVALAMECGLILSGCAGVKHYPLPATGTAANLLGVWNGMTVNDCSPVQFEPARCRAVERISLTMLASSETSWGFYRCAAGTVPCYDYVDRGEIKYLALTGRMLWLRVMRDDHSSCLFDTIPGPDRMRGRFWCFQGATLIERGSWQVDRVY